MPSLERKYFNKLYLAVAMLIGVILTGVTGFMLIEDYTLAESFYMTVIVVSTVGLGAVRDLSPEGRMFISVLILVSLVIVTYGLTITSSFILDGDLRRLLKIRAMKQKINALSGHVIVAGYGRNGRQACEQLKRHHRQFVVVESKPDAIEVLRNAGESLFIEGDATRDDVLLEAGILKASALITTLPNDADNVFVVLTARGLSPSMKIISRASEDTSFLKIKRAGADNVIMPDKIGGVHMASLIAQPDVLEFIDVITGKANFDLEEVSFESCRDEIIGRTLGEVVPLNGSGVNVIGIKNPEGAYRINPSSDTVITRQTKLFVLGATADVEQLIKSLS
jgi:voltage-gated potassium channel